VLAFLLREFRDADHARTFVKGIQRLPPGHLLVVDGRNLRLEAYWTIDGAAGIWYRRDEDYVDRFAELFAEAVRCRLRSLTPVGLFVSGGLDSSAVAATAARLAGAAGSAVPALEAFTMYSRDPGSDEREHARRLVRAIGIKGHELDTGDRTPGVSLRYVLELDSPVLAVGHERDDENVEAIRSRGCRVVLGGEGGDQLLDEIGYLADLLGTLRPLRFLSETRALARWYGASVREVAVVAANCALPDAAKYWGKRIVRGVPPPWLNRETARAVDLRSRVRSPRVPLRFASFAQADTYGLLLGPYNLLKLEVDEGYGSRIGIEFRHPFLDSRLVEFVLAIPGLRRTRDGERKRILREAMRGVVPPEVLGRRGKGDWTESMDRALLALCRSAPPAPLRDESGLMTRYVDFRGAEALVRRYLSGRHRLRWELWSLVTLDRWLTRFGGGAR
jgi:asparagine synthase (glutamine-hydrolysing)